MAGEIGHNFFKSSDLVEVEVFGIEVVSDWV
jgi:hypothetical protein